MGVAPALGVFGFLALRITNSSLALGRLGLLKFNERKVAIVLEKNALLTMVYSGFSHFCF